MVNFEEYVICIVFNKNKLLELLGETKNKYFYGKMKYIDNIDIPCLYDNDFSISHFDYVEKHKESFFFTKTADYRDENEFRVVVYYHKNNEDNVFVELIDNLDVIEAVILGHKFPEIYRYSLETLEYLKNKIYKISWYNGRSHLHKLENSKR